MYNGQLLFHYTSIEGFLKIIQTGCIWATQINFLNDYTEGRMFLDALETELRKDAIVAEYSPVDIAKNVRNAIEEFCWWKIPRFSTSFCEHLNADEIENGLLSQWRGYAEGGVALAFDKYKLLEACANLTKETGWNHALRPVVYVRNIEDISKKLEPLNLEMNNVLEFANIVLDGNIDNIFEKKEKFKPLIDALINIAPFIKHAGFEQEHEYRMTIAPDYFEKTERVRNGIKTGNWNHSDLSVKFRAGGGRISPYLEALRFKSDDLFRESETPQGLASCLTKVIIGPGKMSVYNLLAAKALLSSRNVNVDISDIPYQ
jgi:Protein of unknown function (DUF2971)